MRWKRQRWRRSETAADKYNNQLIAAVKEMAETATAMAVAMVTVWGHYVGGDGDDYGEDDVYCGGGGKDDDDDSDRRQQL